MRFRVTFRMAAVALIVPWLVTAMALAVLVGGAVEGSRAVVAAVAMVGGMLLGCILSLGLAAQMARFLTRARDALRDLPSGAESSLPGSLIAEQAGFASAFNTMAAQWRASRQALSHQAFHDPLTGLANRAAFMTAASEALSRARGGEPVAMLFIDLDRFKAINDTLGHGVGDNLLAAVAARLAFAAGSSALVARLGGDEFTILLTGPGAESRAIDVAEDILERLRRPISIGGRELFANASIGIAGGAGSMVATELLRRADIALYRAKERGKGRYVCFHESDDLAGQDPVQMDAALRHAIEREELALFYQPEVDLTTGRIVGIEALLRWNHPHLGVLSPNQFIAMAEESGEIARLGQWALDRACRDALRLRSSTPGAADLSVAVNVSASEFVDPGLIGRIASTLRRTGLPPRALKLELTESILVTNLQTTAETIAALRRIGVQVAIDDFGTGYSSLSYLHAFEADTLKIDQSFVHRIGQDERSGAIIDAIVELARALHMGVVAEGVESPSEAAYLLRAGCDTAQGHYFAEPLPLEDLEALIAVRAAHRAASSAA